jgi:hypothetical protein
MCESSREDSMAKKKRVVKPRPKQFTVIGFYENNDQPYMEHTMALTPQKAVISLRPESDVLVVDVLAGHHCGLLNNEELVTAHATPQHEDEHYLKCTSCGRFVPETVWKEHDC